MSRLRRPSPLRSGQPSGHPLLSRSVQMSQPGTRVRRRPGRFWRCRPPCPRRRRAGRRTAWRCLCETPRTSPSSTNVSPGAASIAASTASAATFDPSRVDVDGVHQQAVRPRRDDAPLVADPLVRGRASVRVVAVGLLDHDHVAPAAPLAQDVRDAADRRGRCGFLQVERARSRGLGTPRASPGGPRYTSWMACPHGSTWVAPVAVSTISSRTPRGPGAMPVTHSRHSGTISAGGPPAAVMSGSR